MAVAQGRITFEEGKMCIPDCTLDRLLLEIQEKQSWQKADHDMVSKIRQFQAGECEFVKNQGRGERW